MGFRLCFETSEVVVWHGSLPAAPLLLKWGGVLGFVCVYIPFASVLATIMLFFARIMSAGERDPYICVWGIGESGLIIWVKPGLGARQLATGFRLWMWRREAISGRQAM